MTDTRRDPLHDRVEDFPARHTTQIRVRYAETDAMSYVYYGNYPLYFEVGRNETMRALQCPYNRLEQNGIMMPVIDMRISYGPPARYDDLLVIHTAITQLRGPSITFLYRVERARDHERIVTGYTRHALVDTSSRKPIRAPQYLIDAIPTPHA